MEIACPSATVSSGEEGADGLPSSVAEAVKRNTHRPLQLNPWVCGRAECDTVLPCPHACS